MTKPRCLCPADVNPERPFSVRPLIFSNLTEFKGQAEIYSCICGIVRKIVRPQYLKELDSSYNEYTTPSKSSADTTELPVLEFGSKHESIAEWILQEVLNDNMESPALLDWGCGDLDLLFNIEEKSVKNDLKLFGYDKFTTPVKKTRASEIQIIRSARDFKFKNFKFDYVSLIHTLEHFVELIEEVRSVRAVLKPNGKIFVQLPNLRTNPFDIYVADHIYHFTPDSIANLLQSNGFEILDLSSRISNKEISVLAKKTHAKSAVTPNTDIEKRNNLQTFCRIFAESWIHALKNLDQKERVAIYGIGIAGSWFHRLSRDLGIKICFFIDDNKQTSKYKFNDIPIVGSDALNGMVHPNFVILPFETPLALEKSRQLKRIGISSIYFDFDTNQIRIIDSVT